MTLRRKGGREGVLPCHADRDALLNYVSSPSKAVRGHVTSTCQVDGEMHNQRPLFTEYRTVYTYTELYWARIYTIFEIFVHLAVYHVAFSLVALLRLNMPLTTAGLTIE